MKRKKGFFSISAVAKMFSIHQQTIRLYEKEGLISPKRSSGNTRLFSEEDVDRLEEIVYLTHQLGINLAGVEMIFRLKRQIGKMQKEMNKIFETSQKELDQEAELAKQVVSTSAKQLMKIKQKNHPEKQITDLIEVKPRKRIDDDTDIENWEVEYDE
ncbi:MerR family transcriptional regulator [Candidatus Dependentiae bacterium Noda2021]|nr:MerR family transcriptional regulator [Candidatus Dependentiae bacterium Noda2021]